MTMEKAAAQQLPAILLPCCRVADVGLGRYILYFALYMTSVEFFVYWQHRMLHMGVGYRCVLLAAWQAGRCWAGARRGMASAPYVCMRHRAGCPSAGFC